MNGELSLLLAIAQAPLNQALMPYRAPPASERLPGPSKGQQIACRQGRGPFTFYNANTRTRWSGEGIGAAFRGARWSG
jgi:hypothetical protein